MKVTAIPLHIDADGTVAAVMFQFEGPLTRDDPIVQRAREMVAAGGYPSLLANFDQAVAEQLLVTKPA